MCLQVDYESEEEETEEEEDKEDQGELEENAEDTLQESQPEMSAAHVVRSVRGRREERKDEDNLNQMRVNAVLQSSPAIQRYSFDEEQQLWCEVCHNWLLFMKTQCYSIPERESINTNSNGIILSWLQYYDLKHSKCVTITEGPLFMG